METEELIQEGAEETLLRIARSTWFVALVIGGRKEGSRNEVGLLPDFGLFRQIGIHLRMKHLIARYFRSNRLTLRRIGSLYSGQAQETQDQHQEHRNNLEFLRLHRALR
jgi:hypothetical protein